jgi:two-component system alkaline phosphatase synthesis response regulator PhoP
MTRILSLDDESQMLDLMRLILERDGYEFLGTTDEQEALSILRTQPVDLFTQDFMRPGGLCGAEFLRQLKSDEALRDIPVIGVSARARDARAKELELAGMDMDRDLDGYIEKPFGPHELLEVIEAALRRRRSVAGRG